MALAAHEPALNAAPGQFGLDELEQLDASATAALVGVDVENVHRASQAGFVVKARGNEADEVADQLKIGRASCRERV